MSPGNVTAWTRERGTEIRYKSQLYCNLKVAKGFER